ncbi:MAG: YqzL family protein [Candidatus Goldbacteria bacterium]|nr:YqzL family protein [Candidatus Goldiibacteriota bacterium]
MKYKEMHEKFDFNKFLIELWKSFEKTGSISAFLLYNELKKKNERSREVKIRKADAKN